MERKTPFTPVAPEEKEKREAASLDKLKALEEAEKLAYKCINNKDFIKYKAKYEIAEREAINFLIGYDDTEPMRYAFRVRIVLGKLHQLRLLIKDVEADARNRKK